MSYTESNFDDYQTAMVGTLMGQFRQRMDDLYVASVSTSEAFSKLGSVLKSINAGEWSPGDFARAFYKGRKGPICEILSTDVGRTGSWENVLQIRIVRSDSVTIAPSWWFKPLTPLEAIAMQAD